VAESLIGQLLQLVRFAIAAGVEMGQDLRGRFGNWHFADLSRLADMVAEARICPQMEQAVVEQAVVEQAVVEQRGSY
jgi:hypothetical protein